MAGTITTRCAFCGEPFTVPRRPGPEPTYCSPAHRQRAYEQRRRTTRSSEEHALAEEVNRLRARIRWLEHDNAELRRERDEATAEMIRLSNLVSPPSPGLTALTAPPGTAPPTSEPPARQRRWKLSR
jgi:hypothetical protein